MTLANYDNTVFKIALYNNKKTAVNIHLVRQNSYILLYM